jgi:flagellar M-ring protein FliF
MPEWLNRLKDDLTRLWRNMSMAQRWMFGGVSAALIIALIGIVVVIFLIPQEELLYAGLSESQVSRVTRFLEEQKAEYRIDNSNVYVSGNREKLRADFSYANRNQKTLGGYKVLLGPNWSQTSEQFNETRLRALQEELEITIEQGSEQVEWARVQLTPSNKALFNRDKTKPAASVKVGTQGMGMQSDQVEGIQWLVASSLEGMEPGDVRVVDENNRMLRGNVPSGDRERLSMEQREREVQKQNEIMTAAAAILDPPLGGSSNYTVAAVVELNYDKKEIKETFIDGQEPFLKRKETEETSDEDVSPANVPGTPTNNPDDTLGQGAQSTSTTTSTSEKSEIENEPRTRRETKTEVAPGDVTRQSVSILINYPPGPTGEEKKPWPDDFVKSLQGSLEAAVGHIDSSTRYSFILNQVPFDTSSAESAATQIRWDEIRKNVESGFFLLIALASTLAFFYLLKRVFSAPYEEEELEEVVEVAAKSTLDDFGLRDLSRAEDLTEDEKKSKMLREQVETYARHNPEQVAQILRNWMVE